jgi:hypothetical protein
VCHRRSEFCQLPGLPKQLCHGAITEEENCAKEEENVSLAGARGEEGAPGRGGRAGGQAGKRAGKINAA